jgi:xanthine dehydrogenase accessory factor
MLFAKYPVLVRGAGEHASAIAWHLHQAGFPVVLTELPEPLGVTARLCGEPLRLDDHGRHGDAPPPVVDAAVAARVRAIWGQGEIAIVIDAGLALLAHMPIFAIVDARMQKTATETIRGKAPFTVAIGPGIRAGEHADAVVETLRGHDCGRVLTTGEAIHDTGVPGEIAGETVDRVYHAPCEGRFWSHVRIGDLVRAGDLIGVFEGECDQPCTVVARIAGRVRGLLADGERVAMGTKVADIDPRGEAIDPATLSDKGRVIAAGVLTALLAALGRQTAPLP